MNLVESQFIGGVFCVCSESPEFRPDIVGLLTVRRGFQAAQQYYSTNY